MANPTSAKAARVTDEFRRYGTIVLSGQDAEDFIASLESIAPDAEPVARLYDADAFMADGGERMTAAEDVLAWLLIEKIGCVDDQNYTPKRACEIIVAALDEAKPAAPLPAKDAVGEADTLLNGRDIWECANQLHGYVDPGTPDRLAAFLLREGNAAGDLAEEVVRLRRLLAASSPPKDAQYQLDREMADLEDAQAAAKEGDRGPR